MILPRPLERQRLELKRARNGSLPRGKRNGARARTSGTRRRSEGGGNEEGSEKRDGEEPKHKTQLFCTHAPRIARSVPPQQWLSDARTEKPSFCRCSLAPTRT
jgi:hypothetical protein